ncbi:MAG: ABC transporter substrate-binding protein [Spirochaetaceae bacterium]|nr:ABC transporter substrate-binding protein [Spirochaetaceae bacterium]
MKPDWVSPHQGQITAIPFESITATDRYTVVFKTTEAQQDTLRNLVIHHAAWVYPPEVIREHGNIQDWRHAVGTGPYMLTDVVEGVSMTFTRNPDYWGFDEKYPDNRLPYIDELTGLQRRGAAEGGQRDRSVPGKDPRAGVESQASAVQRESELGQGLQR